MAIVVNPAPPPPFIVQGRVGFNKDDAKFVDRSTGWMRTALTAVGQGDTLGPTERRYDPTVPHQDITGPGGVVVTPGQGTMRAHHIADHEIQETVCDFMNGVIGLPTMLDRLGALFFTSWIDVVITPRLFRIWTQWAVAMGDALALQISGLRGLSRAQQAKCATTLAKRLSSSVANLRVGHGDTDVALGHGIAPRLQRGQFDLFGYFIGYANGHNFALPTLSVETSLACVAWGGHFGAHPLVATGGKMIVNNVFVAQSPGGNLFISEQDPVLGAATSTIAPPQPYPGTQGVGGYVLRATRATVHLGVVVLLLAGLLYILERQIEALVWPKGM